MDAQDVFYQPETRLTHHDHLQCPGGAVERVVWSTGPIWTSPITADEFADHEESHEHRRTVRADGLADGWSIVGTIYIEDPDRQTVLIRDVFARQACPFAPGRGRVDWQGAGPAHRIPMRRAAAEVSCLFECSATRRCPVTGELSGGAHESS